MLLPKSRYALLAGFGLFYLSLNLVTRIVLLVLVWQSSALSLLQITTVFFKGLVYDAAVLLFMSLFYSIYLLVLPQRFVLSVFNKVFSYTSLTLVVFLCILISFAEIAFWLEFESRFNFIAVDYLIYTYEVVHNINESYPLPLLLGGVGLLTTLVLLLFRKHSIFHDTFYSCTKLRYRVACTLVMLGLCVLAAVGLTNQWAAADHNRYQSELSKNGIFSFVSAFKANEIDYDRYYIKENDDTVFAMMRSELKEPNVVFSGSSHSLLRKVSDSETPVFPNVIMITIESFSSAFMNHFGNTGNLTPFLDSIADESTLFTNMFATGTRTVRGMEALSLSIPPTPGNSIVRRLNNHNLFNVGTVFSQQGYQNTFFYGGDGYFDNMNAFFGNNGFDVVDRGGRMKRADNLQGHHTIIDDSKVHFANAWGICDEDLLDAVIEDADVKFQNKQLFYDFVMTTSNHKPYTYPANKIDIASGTGRDGAVKYTDFAMRQFIAKAKQKAWFKNTVIIFVADHCANSAGKNELNIDKYKIPCIIYNLHGSTAGDISKQCSQIDLYPTLWGLFHWNYTSSFYGRDVRHQSFDPRAYISTYQKLGYLKQDTLLVLSPGQKADCFSWNKLYEQRPIDIPPVLLHHAIADYQSAFELFKAGEMKASHL